MLQTHAKVHQGMREAKFESDMCVKHLPAFSPPGGEGYRFAARNITGQHLFVYADKVHGGRVNNTRFLWKGLEFADMDGWKWKNKSARLLNTSR